MASIQKSYMLVPSWSLKPSEIALGSVITSVKRPQKSMSNKDLPTEIDSDVYNDEAKNISGQIKVGNKWGIGLFATFATFIFGLKASHSSMSSSEIEYSCESMETIRFTPSPEFIAKASADMAVKSHLKVGGIGAKAFLVTGVKIAKGVTITTTEETKKDTTLQVGAEIPAAQITVGPKLTINPSKYRTHTQTIDGPIVFAFEVEKLCVSRKGAATTKGYAVGAMLGQMYNEIEYVVEIADEVLDDDDMNDFRLKSCDGLEENGEKCRIILPCV